MKYTDKRICASKGSTINISCLYQIHKDHVESKFWFSPEHNQQWPSALQSGHFREDSQFAGRIHVFETERGHSTLRITDLRESDSAQFHFKFTARGFEWRSSLPGTTLTVTGTDEHKVIHTA